MNETWYNLGYGSNKEAAFEADVNYIVQDILLPDYTSFTGSYVYEDNLYYAASGYNELSHENESGIYLLKTDGTETETDHSGEEDTKARSPKI